MMPNWTVTGSLGHIKREITDAHNFEKPGWYSKDKDWILLREIIPGTFEALVWSGYDPRRELRECADAVVQETL